MTDNHNQSNRSGAELENPEKTAGNFAEDIAQETPQKIREEHLEASAASDDKHVANSLPELTDDELSRLSILQPGTSLEQGAVYFNLKDRARGPFKAIGGQETSKSDQIIAKKMTDYEMWNRITGNPDDIDIERPE